MLKSNQQSKNLIIVTLFTLSIVLTSVIIFSYSTDETIKANNIITQIQKRLNQNSAQTLQEPKIEEKPSEQNTSQSNPNTNITNTPSSQTNQVANNTPTPNPEPTTQTTPPSPTSNPSPTPNQTTPTPTNPAVTPTKIPNVVENYTVTPPSDMRNMPIKKRTFRKLDGKPACEIFTNEMANKVFNQPSRILNENEYTQFELSDDFVGRAEAQVCVYQTTTDDKYIYFSILEAKSEKDYLYILEMYRKWLEEIGIDTTDFYKNYGGGESMGDVLAMKQYMDMNNFSEALVVLNYGQYVMHVSTNLNSKEKIIMLTEMMKELGIN